MHLRDNWFSWELKITQWDTSLDTKPDFDVRDVCCRSLQPPVSMTFSQVTLLPLYL